jgi:hypothetical protein
MKSLLLLCLSIGIFTISSKCQTIVEIPEFAVQEAQAPIVQENSQWCWAASIQAILRYYGITKSQEDIVIARYGTAVNLPSQDTKTMEEALNSFSIDGNLTIVTHSQSEQAISLNAAVLYSELEAQHPILIGFRTGPSESHAVIIYGATFAPNGQVMQVEYFDPWPGKGKQVVSAATFAPLIIAWFAVRVATTHGHNSHSDIQHSSGDFCSSLNSIIKSVSDNFSSIKRAQNYTDDDDKVYNSSIGLPGANSNDIWHVISTKENYFYAGFYNGKDGDIADQKYSALKDKLTCLGPIPDAEENIKTNFTIKTIRIEKDSVEITLTLTEWTNSSKYTVSIKVEESTE